MQIKIAGAGLGSLTSAINLAKNGYMVRVYEKNKDVGLRHHGDFQGLANWTMKRDILKVLKEMNIEKFPYYALNEVELYLPSKNCINIKSKIPLAYLVKRGGEDSFDFALRDLAFANDVEILFNTKGENCQIIGTGPKKVSGIAYGITFESNAVDKKILMLGDEYTGKGYAYLFIINGKGTLCTVLFENFERAKKCLEKTINTFKELGDFDIRNERRFGGFGNFFIPNSGIENGKILIGEGAGFQDYLFGFGMKYAIFSGYFSAKSIIENKNYDELWKNAFLNQLKVSVVNRYIFRRLSDRGLFTYDWYFRKWKDKDVLKELYRIYSPSLLKSLLYFIAKREVNKFGRGF